MRFCTANRKISGGQRQRVAMGRAIVSSPAVFLMDEPLSNLDAKLRVSMRAEIARLHQRLQTTMIYVTHDQVKAMTLGDRIVVTNDGVIQQVATPMELYRKPINAFVAGFIGNPSMNFLAAELHEDDGKLFAKGNSFSEEIPLDIVEKLKHVPRNVCFGIRPEDVFEAEAVMAERQEIAAKGVIDVVEMLGAETLLHVHFAGGSLVLSMPSSKNYKAGEAIALVFLMDRMHAFDTVTCKSLLV